MADTSDAKIPLPTFLKMLTSNNVPASKAMAVAGKIYKTYNTPQQLGLLSDHALQSSGVDENDVRKLVLAAIRKAGYKQRSSLKGESQNGVPSTSSSSNKTNTKAQKKRKRDDTLNEFLPDRPAEEGDSYGSLEFNEVLDEETIKPKSTVINRAPIMMAWAFVVAERLGFRREEALSIASVYTEMNAITKGVSLGIYADGKQKGMEATHTGSQPYVELMGRRPLYQTASSQWRGLSAGSPVAPTAAFSYITRSLRQTAPHVVGALRLLAATYPSAELNKKGFGLYAEFRPEADGWGQRGQVRCSTILSLRKPSGTSADDPTTSSLSDIVKVESSGSPRQGDSAAEEPARKKLKSESPQRDEFDAALDDDIFFDELDLSSIP